MNNIKYFLAHQKFYYDLENSKELENFLKKLLQTLIINSILQQVQLQKKEVI